MIIESGKKLKTADIIRLAEEAGLTFAATAAMDAFVTREEVREMCIADRCKSYGKSWSCPPAAGTIEDAEARMRRYRSGIIVQTSGETEGEFDMQGIRRLYEFHTRSFDTFVRQLRTIYPACMPMGAGACARCRKCTYPDRPCRYPDRLYPAMEAYGLLVSDVCIRSGLKYNYGENTMTFTSCVLIEQEGIKG